jgi:hypothetical protein
MPLPWEIYRAEAVTSKLLGLLYLRPTTFTGLPGESVCGCCCDSALGNL